MFSLTSITPNITPISGFHPNSDTDPFAKKDLLEVTSAPTPVVGLNGVRATVGVGCTELNPIVSLAATVFGAPLGVALAFKISIVGTDLDIVTTSSVHTNATLFGPTSSYSTQDHSVQIKMRFDDEDTVFGAPPASDTHHVEFPYYGPQHANDARRLLLGVSANGHNINL
jgi:hypothetical protein